ncbi:MAG: NRDE family protein [Spongiibacteraceae bacterium]
MCLILLSWQQHSDYPLVVAANRDEFLARPTQTATFWPEQPDLYAGKDLEFGGSWFGVNKNGRFAAITNLRDAEHSGDQSRGNIVTDFLQSHCDTATFFHHLESQKSSYRPFNFIASDGVTLGLCSSADSNWKILPPGIHAVGNTRPHNSSHKIDNALKDFQASLSHPPEHKPLMLFLSDEQASEAHGDEISTALSCRFVRLQGYGTRTSTVLVCQQNGAMDYWERNFHTEPGSYQDSHQYFHIR